MIFKQTTNFQLMGNPKLVLLLIILLSGCNQPNPENAVEELPDTAPGLTQEELEVKTTVENFLVVAGNYDLEAMDEMISDKASIGIGKIQDGKQESSVITIQEYIEVARYRELKPYFEPVKKWTITISEDQLAFVRADAVLYSFGVPRSYEDDFFTLIRKDDDWIFMNLSYTARAFPTDSAAFDPEIFARSYAQAWSGVRPEFVASYFAEDGSLRVNEGEPAVGRAAIAKIAKGFMTDLPDMVVHYDSLVSTETGTEFHWTLTATHAASGNAIDVSGYEVWKMENGRIKESQGYFPDEEYEHQVSAGH